ncbi:MAG TPA: hypothetical protein ENG89_00595 [Candidatus Moranbacteria bacterium]|nr:hypothetical protein [Candidatus Moranbacteria bacterium]
MAGLLSWVKIENFASISKLWKYSGLAVGEDGMAMKLKKGQSICWNPKVKTLMWKIGESFVKTKGGYRDLYSQFRKEYDEKWAVMCTSSPKACRERGKCCDGHRFAAAKRKTVKVFEAHYWQKSRLLKGLPIESPFIIGRDSHTHEIPIIER